MKKGVISLGEALIDFIPLDPDNTTYQKSPGGAPANVAVGVARLGAVSTFIGKVGEDVLGRFLRDTLDAYKVNTSRIIFTSEAKTGVVFVTNADNGERSFEFYIDPSADQFLKDNELVELDFTTHKILHIGSITMINQPSKQATQAAVQLAKENDMLISYDPNLRLGLWKSEEAARETIISMLPHADLLKLSEEELEFLTGEKDIQAGVHHLKEYNIPLIFITLGAEGSYIFTSKGQTHVPAMKVQAIDTTGAGDAFVSGLLYRLQEYEGALHSISLEEAEEMVRFASVSGALAASTKGAMTALPTLDEVKRQLEE
jgi:fructokinase